MKTPRESPDGGASDRNIKRRTEAPSTGGSSGADDSLFISPEKKSSFERSYRHRKIINGSKFAFYGPEGDRIAGNIEAIGWTPMITMDLPVYPRLVRLFYCNLEYKHKPVTSITSLVNGTPIRLDCRSLAAILGIPGEGSGEAPEYFRWCGYDSSRWPTAKYFTEKKRVLHDMLLSTFVPRRHHGRLSGMEKLLMNKILCGERANLCYFILCHMIEFIKCHREDLDLPYGMLLTKVFNAFDVVISPEEEFETMNPGYHCDFFRGGNVRINAGWRSGSLQEVEENDEEGSGDEGQAVEPPAIETESLSKLNAQVDSVAPSVEDLQCQSEQRFAILEDQEEEPGDEEEAGEVAAIETDTANESVSKLDGQADSVSPSVEELQCQPEQGFAILDEPLSKLTARMDSVDSKLSALAESVASLVRDGRCQREEGLANLNESLGKLTHRVDSLDGKLTARVDSVDSKLTARVDSVDTKLTARVDSVDTKLTARMDTVASSVQSLRCEQEKRFSDLNSKLDSLMGFLSYHFCPYPPPPTPFNG